MMNLTYMEFLSFILGASVSWWITYYYYNQSSKDLKKQLKRQSDNLEAVIMKNPNDLKLIAILETIKHGKIDASRLEGEIDGGTFD